MNRKSFDNLVVKGQGELSKQGETENGDAAKAKEDVPSCEHQDQREEKEGITRSIYHKQLLSMQE